MIIAIRCHHLAFVFKNVFVYVLSDISGEGKEFLLLVTSERHKKGKWLKFVQKKNLSTKKWIEASERKAGKSCEKQEYYLKYICHTLVSYLRKLLNEHTNSDLVMIRNIYFLVFQTSFVVRRYIVHALRII